jgi:thiol:disulfide interchange protein
MKSLYTLILACFFTLSLSAQIEKPVTWSFSKKKISDTEYDLIFKASIQKGWYTYSQYLESDDGPVRTSFNYDKGNHFTLVGKNKEISSHRKEGPEPLFDNMNLIKFSEEVTFVQRIKLADATKAIKGYLEFMTCDNEKCLPPEEVDFVFDLSKESKTGAVDPVVIPPADNKTPFETTDPSNATASVENVVTQGSTDTASTGSSVATGSDPGAVDPVLAYKFDQTQAKSNCNTTTSEESPASLWLLFVLGFIGGLIAFITPCILPMVPLTVSYFIKSSTTKAKGISNAVQYALSIIIIYTGVGLLLTAIFGADALNVLSTNAVFNVVLFLLFIAFAFSFFGYYELTLPSSWANKTESMSSRGGFLGIFFMAFTLAIVSFSCTGLIAGSLLVQTVSGTGPQLFGRIPLEPVVGMFGFSVALALPFALFAGFPAWLKQLPKSGSWMNIVKVTLGFIEIALAFKFLSVADMTKSWKILPYELFLAVWILCALALVAYYFGFIRFPGESKPVKVTPSRWVLGLGFGAMVIYFAMGFRLDKTSETFDSPNLLSGILPPPGYSYIYPKECPLDFNCFHDFESALAYARQEKKPLLVDFTGYGCVNCRRMEDNVWDKEGVYDLIKKNYVLVSLYVDDRKELEQPYTSALSGRTVKTVGKKWTELQIAHFNRNSQPYYVLLDNDLKVLNEPRGYTPDIIEYKDFLQCGYDRFQEGQQKLLGSR